MTKQIFPAMMLTVVLTVIVGVIYPLAVTGVAQLFFREKAQGSLIVKNGKVIGSRLIGQPFSGAGYFHSRPSAAGNGYDAGASGGTNLSSTSAKLLDEKIKPLAQRLSEQNHGKAIPVDLVTSSASGLDPHITPAAAEFQVPRVARERGISESEIRKLVLSYTEHRTFGLLGEPRVNVLLLNLALDDLSKR
ncbi:MAG: potassium-transporting ATPase subunit KdpC [Acidobacteriota bacterium]